jgi:hypothetical protein
VVERLLNLAGDVERSAGMSDPAVQEELVELSNWMVSVRGTEALIGK